MANINFNGLKTYKGKVTSADLNRVIDALQTIALCPGVGYTLLQTPAGTTIRTQANAAVSLCELKAVRQTATTVRVQWGRVNNMQPAVFAGVRYWEFACTETAYLYAYADYDTDSGQWSGADLVSDPSATMENTSTRVYAQIAACIVDDSGLAVNSICGPITLDVCSLVID